MKFHEIPFKTHISLHSNVYSKGKLSKMSPWVSASFSREISDRVYVSPVGGSSSRAASR